eukprot:TRINITY_DN16619_c0_g1_i1.p1 TRINITY_DN16619_c0_g1~~TRINITY_DN16619_c0_g1_i1.p1  ORF type:complete len:300 (+),score=44.95 TRINITY_DN16619_c0_g1_i1:70-900(+)
MKLTFLSVAGERVDLDVEESQTIDEVQTALLAGLPRASQWVVALDEAEYRHGQVVIPLEGKLVRLGNKCLWEAREGLIVVLRTSDAETFVEIVANDELRLQASLAENGIEDGAQFTFIQQPVPNIRMYTGDSHWTEQNAPSFQEDIDLGGVITTAFEKGPREQHCRQCVKCVRDYKIHFCAGPDLTSVRKTIDVSAKDIAILHRKTGPRPAVLPGAVIDVQIKHKRKEDGRYVTYLIFEGGYPRGGESFADVHAPWGTCYTSIPRGGSTIIEMPWR